MLLSWIRAKKAELAARRARALSEARLAEALSDPWGAPSPETDEPDWIPIGHAGSFPAPSDRVSILRKARRLHLSNPIARGIVETHVSFVLGDGFRLQVAGEPERSAGASEELARILDDIRFTHIQEETVRRFFRDGECFLRAFPDVPAVRFLEPDDIRSDDPDFPDGMETDPLDAATVLRIHSASQGPIDASEIIHLKHGADSNVTRGIPLLYPVFDRIRRFDSWLDDLGALIKLRTAVALIRKHSAPPETVRSFAEARSTGSVSRREGTLRLQKIRPGTIIDSSGVDYEFKSPNVDASDLAHFGRSVLLSIASGVGLAEHMVSSDASNNNYSSLEVAETVPFERFRRFKALFSEAFASLARRLLSHRLDIHGLRITCRPAPLPVRDEKARVEALSTALSDGIVSRSTYASRLGLDWNAEQALISRET